MKQESSIQLPEILYVLSFFLYLVGSSLALIEQGVELSLWLMTFALVVNFVTTLFPLLGVKWLKLSRKGSQAGYWIAMVLQVISWITLGYGMYFRLYRNLPQFYLWITITTLLWVIWQILFIYTRHAYQHHDKLR